MSTPKLTKAEIIEAIFEKTQVNRKTIHSVVDQFFDEVKLALMEDRIVELRGFGVFQVKPRKRGIGRNPRTGKEVKIPPGRTIRFKPGKELQNIGGE